jgi:uncharacterized tellurite resistance protein B-like protein
MLGFFEHQYLSYKKNHIRNLLALAKVDGHVHEKEEKLLYRIGKKYGLKERQIKELVDSDEKHEINVPDNHNDKMNLLYDLLLMVHADEKIEKQEITFVEEVVQQLGLKKEILPWLIKSFEKGIPPRAEEWDDIKRQAREKFVVKH